MKKLVLVGIVCLSLFLITGLAYAEEKLAYVNFAQLFTEYSKTKAYDTALEKKQKDFEKEREEKVNEVKKMQEKLSLLSEAERESRKGDLEDKIAQLQEFDRSATQDLRKERDDKAQEIFKNIQDVIKTYAQKEGITLVFDKRSLVYETKSLDITDQVLKILNKK